MHKKLNSIANKVGTHLKIVDRARIKIKYNMVFGL